MCDKPNGAIRQRTIQAFLDEKQNKPTPEILRVRYKPCLCGGNFVARYPSGDQWVRVEEVGYE